MSVISPWSLGLVFATLLHFLQIYKPVSGPQQAATPGSCSSICKKWFAMHLICCEQVTKLKSDWNEKCDWTMVSYSTPCPPKKRTSHCFTELKDNNKIINFKHNNIVVFETNNFITVFQLLQICWSEVKWITTSLLYLRLHSGCVFMKITGVLL
jgi:hypothetical protein